MHPVTCLHVHGLVFLLAQPLLSAAPLSHVDVFASGRDGYFGYRIPALEVAADGTLLAFAEARKNNLADPGYPDQEIDLVLKRSRDGGRTWSAMQVIEDADALWCSANPATVLDRSNGRVWLFYLRCRPGRNTQTARPGTDDILNLARFSDDHGATWSDPRDLTAVARDMTHSQWRCSVPGPGGAIQTRAGHLLVPHWKVDPWGVLALISTDQGATWERSALMPGGQAVNENQLVELDDGRLLMDARQSSGAHRWITLSSDGGRHWSEPRPGETVTAVACAIERWTDPLAESAPGVILWTGLRGPSRSHLILRISRDQGRTFGEEQLLYDGLAAYSDLAVLQDRDVGMLWERGTDRGYQFITFTRLPAARFQSSP